MLQREFDRRSLLPDGRSALWQIESGAVRTLTWLEDGTAVILGIWGAGDIVGALPKVESHQIECLTKVKATSLADLHWQKDPEVLTAHIQQAQTFLLIRSQRRLDMALVKLLTWLGHKFGKESELGQVIDVRLTHQDIAEMLGTTRVTITRLLSQLEQQGLIQRLPPHRILLREEEFWHYEI